MSSVSTPTHVDLAVLGTVVRVHIGDHTDKSAVEHAWHLCVLPETLRDVPEGRVVALTGSTNAGARLSAMTSLTQNVTRAAIAEQTGRLLMFHAGAVSNLKTGATVAYVAPGGTGKTTITKTLGRGRGYITDETVAVTRTGDVVAYPKPLSLRRLGGGKEEVAPRELGLQPANAQPWLARLLVVRRDSGHVGKPTVREFNLLDAIAALSPETSALAALSEPLATCRDVVDRAGGLLHVTYREASDLEEIVKLGLATGKR